MTEPQPRRALNEHEFSGAHVLDSMQPKERSAFETHLRDCELCRRDVREFRETLSGLKELVGQPPPPTLRASLLGAIRGVAQLSADDARN